MNIHLPQFYLSEPATRQQGIEMLRRIEEAARISHRTESKFTESSWERFIQSVVIGHGDWSVTEHVSVSTVFQVNRGITHELVRHRLFGFTQESTRFVNYAKDGFEAVYIPSTQVKQKDKIWWDSQLETIDAIYREALNRGYAPQIARDFLPTALGAQIAVTGNLRNWRHFFLMRTSKETHPDFKVVTIPLLEQFKERIPILFDDIEPNARQIDNMRKPR